MALLDRFAGPHEAYRVGFYRGDDHDFDVRILLGMAAYGATEPGEVLATIADVSDGDHQGWFDAWNDLGRRLTVAAEAAAAAGHSESASRLHLRAASYLGTALHGVDALADQSVLLPVFRAQQAAWNAFIDTTSVTTERLSIPLGDITMPAVLFSPSGDDGARRPTLVMVNGSDGATSDLWASGLAGGLARGYRVLVFDGPGQQTLLFEQGIPFRPDWEAVVTPIVDLLLDRSDVDPERLALYGISQAGYWVPRTLAFEHRFAAAIADPGVVDVSESWLSHFPKSMVSLLDRGEKERFDHEMELGMRFAGGLAASWSFRARPYGTQGYFDTMTEVRKYTITAELAAQITTPLLITSPEGEQFWPGQSERLAQLTPTVSTLCRFTSAEGGDHHCQPLARQLTDQRMYDWLDERLA
ncbi:prolyl oligopeptidase family serine peptidase [Cnuibacter physcomitrellae]|uniref:alpha/beta hydrolase family protein n=1 Tax=Cnuibacter physcomitrellae TaxID=1619308 RepID=UPI0021759228|nr:prolyl oligopeptidase family serine peptidase [Cnuibacter physcomitrellae]MCS5498728.1 prolyl oligopeptidase family serine peptidase [Cnuibacter physcomitrellae]